MSTDDEVEPWRVGTDYLPERFDAIFFLRSEGEQLRVVAREKFSVSDRWRVSPLCEAARAY